MNCQEHPFVIGIIFLVLLINYIILQNMLISFKWSWGTPCI